MASNIAVIKHFFPFYFYTIVKIVKIMQPLYMKDERKIREKVKIIQYIYIYRELDGGVWCNNNRDGSKEFI